MLPSNTPKPLFGKAIALDFFENLLMQIESVGEFSSFLPFEEGKRIQEA